MPKPEVREMVGLSVRELVNRACQTLLGEVEPFQLTSPATAEIADDSDWHRTRKGYTEYNFAAVVQFESNEWVLAVGEAKGDYPARQFCCDLFAEQLTTKPKSEDELKLQVHQQLSANWYFKQSLLVGMADGRLAVPAELNTGQRLAEALKCCANSFVAQTRQFDPAVLDLTDLQPLVISPTTYRPEFVPVIVDLLRELFSKP